MPATGPRELRAKVANEEPEAENMETAVTVLGPFLPTFVQLVDSQLAAQEATVEQPTIGAVELDVGARAR